MSTYVPEPDKAYRVFALSGFGLMRNLAQFVARFPFDDEISEPLKIIVAPVVFVQDKANALFDDVRVPVIVTGPVLALLIPAERLAVTSPMTVIVPVLLLFIP
jgi:hypothetical protein